MSGPSLLTKSTDSVILWLSPSLAPPLTLKNVMAAVKEVKKLGLLCVCFGVNIIVDQYDSDEAGLKAVVEKFLLGEGRYPPTWRAVMFSLDKVNEIALADKIRNYGEPVQGTYICHCSILCWIVIESLLVH